MDIAIFGMGYVGAVSAACLASDGHTIIGVDTSDLKVDLINKKQSPVIEPGVGERITEAVDGGRLSAMTDSCAAVHSAELILICVGTPSSANGNLDLSYVKRVCEEIGDALSMKDEFTAVVVRSTVLPGSLQSLVIPTLEKASGKRAGVDFGVGFFPEFLRESTAVSDFYNPPKIVFAASDDRTRDLLTKMNANIDMPVTVAAYEAAEMVKYADNTWHALKVAFGNEIGSICKSVGIDGGEVMDIFCSDRKLNISDKYLRPGFAFGGSCLPKDVRALAYKGRSLDLDLPLINSIMPSNHRHIDRAFEMIRGMDENRVGVLGLSFKAGTDDLRESPVVDLVERLLGKGHEIRIFDQNVNLSRLVGSNRAYIYEHLPHIAKLMVDEPEEVVSHGGTLVIGNSDKSFADIVRPLNMTRRVVDLVRLENDVNSNGTYNGICW